jgi:mono/diheme cytochrome c family protein
MKNFVKLIVISVFIFTFVIVCSFRSEASKASGSEMNFSNSESSRNLYLNNCARCHGADGKSQTELGRLNDSPDISGGKSRRISTARLTRLITNGKGSMPGFGKKLTKAQISSIVKYVKSL